MDNPFAAISCVSFSYTRPTVFAVGSKDGYVYLFDLLVNLSGPLTTLRLPPIGITSAAQSAPLSGGVGAGGSGGGGGKKLSSGSLSSSGGGHRPRVTGLSFNVKQRDLLSVCDSTGRVLVWKVGWNFANQKANELNYFEKLGNISLSSGEQEDQQQEQQREVGGGGERNEEEA
jgi:WD40 repeat protein